MYICILPAGAGGRDLSGEVVGGREGHGESVRQVVCHIEKPGETHNGKIRAKTWGLRPIVELKLRLECTNEEAKRGRRP
jgi:hypothetical protein